MRRKFVRSVGTGVVSAVLIAFVGVVAIAPPAGATVVSTEQQFRDAFDTDALIDLSTNIFLTCDGGVATRDGSTNVTIDGHGRKIEQDCAGNGVLQITGSNTLTLNNVTITGGSNGAISAEDDVTLNQSKVTGNGGGTAINSDGSVSLTQSSVSDNDGYAIDASGNISLTESTISNNNSVQLGYDSTVATGGFLSLENSTVSGNTANGGALYAGSFLVLDFSTVVDNTITGNQFSRFGAAPIQQVACDAHFAGIGIGANVNTGGGCASFFVHASVVALPHGGPNCSVDGTSSNGYNWDDDGSCGFSQPSDFPDNGDPGLGDLGPNGGPTDTRMPGGGSGLVDQIPPVSCQPPSARFGAAPIQQQQLTDQRGIPRPQGPGCDIGAVELTGDVSQGASVTVEANPDDATEGGLDGAFVFTRTGDTASSLAVPYSTSGTATSGTDYDALASAVIPAGQSSVTIPVHALADNVSDAGETVEVDLSPSANYDLGVPSGATVTILEDFCAGVAQAPYTDRETFDVHAHAIDCITAFGVGEGFPDGTYGATIPVNRSQIASMVARLMARAGVALPSNPPDAFPGDNGSVHELSINQLAALGVLDDTTGQSPPNYNVSDPMQRDDMAQLLVNAYTVIVGQPLPAGPDAFTDDSSSDNQAAINALASANVVQGTGGGLYDPSGSVSRGQMASFFVRYMQLLITAGKLSPTP